MSNDVSVLIVDSNRAFATMFKEGLEQEGRYHVTLAFSGEEALQAQAARAFDLAVVDLGLTDADGATVARTMRQRQPDLRLMVIPLVGEALPEELADLDVQGVLSKPFFLPELPERMAAALARPMGGAKPSPDGGPPIAPLKEAGEAPEEVALLSLDDADVLREMAALARDIHAGAVILTHEAHLIARVGELSDEEADGLAQAVAESWRTSARVAKILGREQLRFEQSVEGGEYLFYSLGVAEDIILSVALRAEVPLGMIRHQAKRTADALRSLMNRE